MKSHLMRGGIAAVSVVLVAASIQFGVVAPAEAGAAGQVMATTQRMSSDTLNSTQVGWYAKGTSVALSCYERGQSVRGFYSPWISGGYDNLWYRASDGYFLADVDINTGSDDPITPACSAPPAAPATDVRAAHAVSWANSMVGSNSYPGLCGVFVANAYGKSALGYTTAMGFFNALNSAGQIHGGTPPLGALVFSKSSSDGGAGHVDIARGDGTFVSGGVLTSYKSPLGGGGHTVQILSATNVSKGSTYLGWAYAPTSWPGR